MVKKKAKAPRPSKRRGENWHVEDVEASTGLPPQVEGQLRCFCRLSVTQVTWNVPNTPDVTHVRMKWWGEPGDGVLFRPVDRKRGSTADAKTTVRYPVRSGPKQFSSYLNDMGSLVLEVLSGKTHVPIGTVEVPGIGQLAPNKPINGLYPMISPTDEKIGELHVSLMLESLMASYDSTGSIPTTDLSMETYTSHVTQESTFPKHTQPVPHTDQPRKPVDDPFISPASHQNADSRLANGYAEDLRQQLNYEPDPVERRYQGMDNGSTVAITTNGDVIRTNVGAGPVTTKQGSQAESSQTGDRNLLSVLLDRGNKLREQMVISALDSKAAPGADGGATAAAMTGISSGGSFQRPGSPVKLGAAGQREDPNISMRSADGSFLREILRAEKLYGSPSNHNADEAAVDLVFGGQLIDEIALLKNMNGSPTHSDDDFLSDPEDPMHNETILNELFYKNVASADDLSDISCDELKPQPRKQLTSMDDESNMRPPSRASSVSSLNLAFPEPEPSKKSKTLKTTPKRKSRVKLKKKGTKKRKSSRSRSRSRVSGSGSDSEALSVASTPRSESSRVSFDMVPSDIEEPPTRDETSRRKKKPTVDGLSVERLTLLGRVHVARVTIDTLNLIGADLDTSSGRGKPKTKYGIRPPRPSPKSKKTCTYFIEYQFPVVATSRDKYSPNAMATEVMRVVSRNVKSGAVTFNHRSVFPVMFDGSAVERWWKYALIFKVFSRTAGQKVPTLIGSCGIPLKSILKSESLHISRDIDVRQADKSGNTSLNGSRVGPEGLIGALKLVVELASDSKEFPTALARTKLAELTGKAKIVPIAQTPAQPQSAPQAAPKPPVPPAGASREPAHGAPRGIESRSWSRTPVREEARAEGLSQPLPVSVQHYQGDQTVLNYPSINQQQQDIGECLTLHTVLLIPDGKSISMQGVPSLQSAKHRPLVLQPSAHAAPGVRARDMMVRNCYLVCRMFWCDESVHSAVCWGTSEPQFKFQQVAPVLASQSLLERLKNNFMIVEVWDKKTSADNDKLVGIVKLSLHQFYMSFRDKRISSALLKSQYPVIAVENYLPVVDPFSGSQYGQINVLLAMGSAEQVAHLVRMKTEGVSAVSAPERPQHYLERQDLLNQGETIPAQIGTESVVEHVFEMVVEGVRGLVLFENMIWGEADCFVQYYFPAQQQTGPPGAPVIRHAVPTMKAFRTATTLCVADPTFNDVTRHRILLPAGTPVQRELLTACANGGGGLPFELWCRFYHPNVRDQCIAKSSLPLAKLCAMITMQRRGEPSVQTFPVALSHVSTDSSGEEQRSSKAKSPDAGLMDITIHYKTQTIQNDLSAAAANKNLTGAQVCISVGVTRACGLKAAAESAAHLDQGMQYPAEVGVNAYVRVKLSFLGPDQGERITRTVARSFCPEFSHFVDFPCPLLWTEADSDALCLAELLESAEAMFEVWHQVPGLSADLDRQLQGLNSDGVSGRQLVEKTGDVLLGSTTLPLATLLSHRTGINGWLPINIPTSAWGKDEPTNNKDSQEPGPTSNNQESSSSSHHQGLHRVGGGLEVSLKFAHHDDRERVIHAARGVGWSPVDLDMEQDEWQSEDEDCNKYHHLNITIDHVNFPLQNALIVGQNNLDKTAQCYVRYKFYDKAAVMSKFSAVTVNNHGYVSSKPRNRHDLQLPDSSMFRWYMREEKLEVQVWVSYGHRKGDEQRPRHRDKLIGSAYIPMDTLCDPRRKQHRVSGMYPLFKPGASSLGGGYIRAHMTARPQFGRSDEAEKQEGLITLDGEVLDTDYDPDDSFHQITSHKNSRKIRNTSPGQAIQEEEGAESGQEGEEQGKDATPTFAVVIQLERALHLPLIKDKDKDEEFFPNTYVSYPTAESSIQSYSGVFHNSDNPVWDHVHETRLSLDMLTQENKHLVFKVWHKPAGAPKSPDKLTDRVLGFVSVDLTPLANGMQQISGWYNVMDFTGQIKGQIKINVIPQDSVICQPTGGAPTLLDAGSLPPSSSFLSLPAWGLQPPGTSSSHLGPLSMPPGGPVGPHYADHYNQVKQHHEVLQQQLQEHIQQFLRQQEDTCQTGDSTPLTLSQEVTSVTQGVPSAITSTHEAGPLSQRREVSIHWRPNMPELRQEESSSRSYLFSALRRNLQDLDDITSNFKAKLSFQPPSSQQHQLSDPEFHIPTTSQSGQYPLTSTQSTITFDLPLPRSQRETPRDELTNTGSNGGESSRTAVDSGAFSVENSNEKYDDSAQTSNRSDRLDTLRSGATPRELLGLMEADSGINQSQNNSNFDELALNTVQSLSPRDEKKDQYSESGGFKYGVSPRDGVYTPRDGVYTPRDGVYTPRDVRPSPRQETNSNSVSYKAVTGVSSGTFHVPEEMPITDLAEEQVKRNDQKQMSMIQEYSENDLSGSEEEGDNRYYHRYRDLLNKEDDIEEKSDDNDDEDDEEEEEEGEIVVPKRINDVSGKFDPTGEIIVLSENFDSSVPYGVSSPASNRNTAQQQQEHQARRVPNQGRTRNTGEEQGRNNEDILQDIESESDGEGETCMDKPGQRSGRHQEVIFDERDSWLSDSDKEDDKAEDHVTSYHHIQNHHGRLQKPKHQRQDSDTGYSSRDNVSESYLTPSAAGTNSETDMSRLHEHEHWDNRDSDDHIFQDRNRNRLLANVELESTGGSFGLKIDSGHHSKTDSGHHSRISSAESRNTRKSSGPLMEEWDEDEQEATSQPNSGRAPVSARSRELEDFFGSAGNQLRTLERRDSADEDKEDSDDDSECDYDRRAVRGTGGRQPVVNGRRDEEEEEESDQDGEETYQRETTPRDQQREVTPRGQQQMPNFFMPAKHLEESLRTLQIVTDKPKDPQQESARAAAASEMVAKLTAKDGRAQTNSKPRLPTAEEAKRIAKIFSSKFS